MDGEPLLAQNAPSWRCVPCVPCVPGLRRRHCIPLLLACVLLYGLYVLVQIRVLEKLVFSGDGGDRPSYHASAAGRSTPRPLPECPAPPRDAPWLLDGPGCRIPAHDAFSAEVRDSVSDFPSIVCAEPPPLVTSNDTHLMVANATNATSCCYTAMWRHEGPHWQSDPRALHDGINHGNDIRFGEACVPFEEAVAVRDEFVRVTCTSAGAEVYRDFHAFVPAKRPRGHAAGLTASEFASEGALNVLVLGIDSVSRLNFIRKMPRTRAFLERRLGARGMLGFNKVEDNTFPNLVPMLSGLSVPELRNACWPNDSAHFDACPWLWKRFNREGYVTMFAEDTAWMGLFHYLKRGFANQPTDYDARPLMYLGEKELGRGGGYNAKYCIGQRHQIEVLLDYARKFLRGVRLQRRKHFALVWGTSLSHDLLNQPAEADALYEGFLRDVEAQGALEDTALIVMSDHGLRFGAILDTYQGHLENMLPFLYVVLPAWVRRRYPLAARHLECNRRRLVTAFDLHRTLLDLVDLRALQDDRVAAEHVDAEPPRGLSLFTAVPAARTCDAAAIPHNYCACQHLTETDTGSEEVARATAFVVAEVNRALAPHPECLRVEAAEVLSARRGRPLRAKDMKAGADENEYQVTLRTRAPAAALLSATVREHVQSGRMQLAGSVSRLNAYGNSSWCVDSTALKALCHCALPALASPSAPTRPSSTATARDAPTGMTSATSA